METALLSPEMMKQAQIIQEKLLNPNPHISMNLPLLPSYLGEIFPFHPLNKILNDLHLVKVLNHI